MKAFVLTEYKTSLEHRDVPGPTIADWVIDYRTEDFETKLSGCDFVLDSLGGDNLEKSLRVLAPGGRAIGSPDRPPPSRGRPISIPLYDSQSPR